VADDCAFCETNKATHFNMDWDAPLCNQCADEQDRLVQEAAKELGGLNEEQLLKELFGGER
jgi:hypothetical protein